MQLLLRRPRISAPEVLEFRRQPGSETVSEFAPFSSFPRRPEEASPGGALGFPHLASGGGCYRTGDVSAAVTGRISGAGKPSVVGLFVS